MTQKQRVLLRDEEINNLTSKKGYTWEELIAQTQLDKAWELAKKEGINLAMDWCQGSIKGYFRHLTKKGALE